jgi:ankyrin repeat protein
MQILETSCCTTLDTVESGADDVRKEEAKNLLHNATEEGNIDTVKPLLEQGMDINARNASDETLLGIAAIKGNVDVVRLLIEREVAGGLLNPCPFLIT